jgi:apoptosis-inducing factor 3
VQINYVGHAETWDTVTIDGDLEKKNCTVRYKQNGHTLAVVTISRDLESLLAEREMESLTGQTVSHLEKQTMG